MNPNNKGFTLIEVLIVIVILGILASIIYPKFADVIARSQEKVCLANCSQIERTYYSFLFLEDKTHCDVFFEEFFQEYEDINICPNEGNISFVNASVFCDYHNWMDDTDSEDDDEDDGVPFL